MADPGDPTVGPVDVWTLDERVPGSISVRWPF